MLTFNQVKQNVNVEYLLYCIFYMTPNMMFAFSIFLNSVCLGTIFSTSKLPKTRSVSASRREGLNTTVQNTNSKP